MNSLPASDGTAHLLIVVRRLVLTVLLLALVGTAGELLLVGHVEGFWQWIPLVLIAANLLAMAWHAWGQGAMRVRAFRSLMFLCMASGMVGVVLHYIGKVEFKLEANPSLAGAELFWAAIKGPAPPVLAPGMMIQIGVLGLAWSYCQPRGTHTKVESTINSGATS